MGTLGSLEIAEPPGHRSGVALVLEGESSLTKTVDPSSDWEVSLKADNSYIVANTSNILDREEAFHQGHEAIQESLDILSFDNKADLICTDVSDERLIWWEDQGAQHLRIVDNGSVTASTSATATVVDADGNIVDDSSPSTEWHEAMRYFRLAQVTNDLFDAYRNIYLSFERILSHIEPKSNEGEGAWLRRVLGNLPSGIDLGNYTDGSTNPVDDFMQEQYEVRNKIFHAKEGESRLRPQDTEDQETVQDSLENLTRFVIALIRETTPTNRSGGVITYAGFDFMTKWMEEKELELLTHRRYPPLVMNAEHDSDTSEPGLKSLLARANLEEENHTVTNFRNWIRAERIQSWGRPRRRVKTFTLSEVKDNRPLAEINLRELLSLENITVLEVQTGLYLINAGMARYQFPR
ncbi:hypothetical protein ACFQE1_03420 [Halobium palmae]|uniref:Apea-like HEPN domain-containing protein n=1 Tax=Halobium palmae TaxID=1776492 RepID=A0ABD5RW39_9EURY